MTPELHRGQLARHPKILSVRALAREDLTRLYEKRVGPRIKKIRRAHHIVARLIAMGHDDEAITKTTGYSQTRIGQLRVDPSMQELVAKLDAERLERVDLKIDEAAEMMAAIKNRTLSLMLDNLDELEDSGEPVSFKTLLPIVTEMADRTGHGKHSTTTSVSVNFAQMMKDNAQRRGRSNVIDAKVSPTVLGSAPVQIANTPSESAPAQPTVPKAPKPVVSFRRRA